MNRLVTVALSVWIAASLVSAAPPTRPYVDPSQLECLWPKHSDYKQPWRGYLETKPAVDFLAGIGVNWASPGNDELAVRLLAQAGFKAFRIEIGWGSVKWDESGVNNHDRLLKLLKMCQQHGIRPTMLLNAHQGVPCPTKFFERRLAADAPKGSRAVKLTDVKDLVIGRSGLSQLSEYWAAEALVTAIDAKTGECQLSQPLPKDLPAEKPVPMATLKYLPLHPVGTREYDETAGGWVKYAALLCALVQEAGINDFDIEIWNELTFGTKFLSIANYHDAPQAKEPDFLNPGGRCWELARRTVDAIKKDNPQVRVIWGFSNTTFYHCAISQLPPGIDGQSYHPYGTGLRKLPQQEQHQDQPQNNLEGFVPTVEIRLPEGWAQTFLQTECLIRLFNPAARKAHPAGTQRCFHYITEHGLVAAECGITDEAGAWDLKSKCALRSFCLWLNKGVDVLHFFNAYQRDPKDMGLLPAELAQLPADGTFDQLATPPLRALRNLTKAFDIFQGDERHPPLRYEDVFAFLPFQVSDRKLVIAVYVMTYDITKPMQEQLYRLAIQGLPAGTIPRSLYDPITGKSSPLQATREGAAVEVTVPVVDYPRLMVVDEGG
ncbi:MAG: hypothetical protein NTY19_12130 [Planctomycetota bacterium]|nr:hypothetical protein [Planctomycetota bacterium]